MGGSSGLVDWRGRPVNKKKHGGMRASIFIHALVLLSNAANVATVFNLVSYLRGNMHMDVARASTISSNFLAALQLFSIPAAFVADSYVKRFYTVLIFLPIEILGYILLTVQAHVPSLHPPPCADVGGGAGGKTSTACEPVHGHNLSLLLLGLYLVTIGDGAARACLPALGGEQFDVSDPVEQRHEANFFNWYTFAFSSGGFLGLVFIVWVQNRAWDLGFLVCAICVLLGLLVWAAGFPLYRNQLPSGSRITRILQVLVVAFKKRNIELPENPADLNQIEQDDAKGLEVLQRTNGFKCLDKAAVDTGGNTGSWSICSVTQVEEAKIILRMVPIFIIAVLGHVPVPLILNFTVQQGNTMDTRLGTIHIPPATLFVIPTVFTMVTLALYDRFIVPFVRRMTGYVGGVTHLQRIGIGFVCAMLASGVAALLEVKRKMVAAENGVTDAGTGVPMSVFWLTFQYFLLGLVDITSFVGLLEFFYSETPVGMKSIGSSIFYCTFGMSAWLGSLLIQLVNRITRHEDGAGTGWLDGTNLNKGKLDRFYWLLSVLELASLLIYMFFAWRYVYHNDQRLVEEGENKTIHYNNTEKKRRPKTDALI